MLREPCRGIFMQPGRWIFILRESLTAGSRLPRPQVTLGDARLHPAP
jgi:hypothetical protein